MAPLRAALEARDWSVRLLVPSATMAEHVRNQLARDGFVLRGTTVSTLTGFVDKLGLADPAPTAAQIDALLANILEQNCPAEYAEVAGQWGFRRHLATSADALSLAGVSPRQLDGALADVYGRLLEALETKGLALRGHRLQQTRQRLTATKLTGVSRLLLDGFFSFSNTEQALLDRLGEFLPVQLTEPIHGIEASFRQPSIELLAAQDQAHEALLVAEGILRLAHAGVPLRRIGILLRNPAAYGPLIDSTLARLDIPSRSYLGTPLTSHPMVAFHRAIVEAARSGWDNTKVWSAVAWRFTGLGGTPTGDTLEQQLRAALPSNSLESFPQLQPFADWPGAKFFPLEAARQLKLLAGLLLPPLNVADDLRTAWTWHQRTRALRSLHDTLDQTAEQIEADLAIGLDEFWRAVETNLADLTLHERDTRRNVVHVMDLFESRQWDLDYVFAPGLSDNDFPQRASPDPLLTESLKRNFGMKTMEDRNAEEHFLYQVLLTRANAGLTLSYPRINSKGDPMPPSSLLTQPPRAARSIVIATPPPVFQETSGQLTRSYRGARAWSASEFEMHLACRWKHFAAKGLNLQGLPETPAERLNPILLGNVAHDAIRLWTLDPSKDIETIAERQLERACREARVPPGYHYERERINLLRNVRIYAKYAPPIPAGWQTYLEQPFSFELADGPAVRGQIDRYDQAPSGEIHAYDYKYSKATGLEDKYPIQGALYAMALGSQVTRFSFIALREQARPALLEGSVLKGSIEVARQMIDEIVADVRAGRVPVDPRNPDNCQYCAFLDACRIRTRVAEEEPTVALESAEA